MVVNDLTSDRFNKYGKVINLDFTKLVDSLCEKTEIPTEGNIYVASVEDFENIEEYKNFFTSFYGGMPYQIGYCNGKNETLNGLEYHKCSEINIAGTDMYLMLGKICDIKDNTYESEDVEVFFVPKGVAIELYSTTLHFAPCKHEDTGFKTIVVLTKGTNEPIDFEFTKTTKEDELLFARNKWLMVHKEREVLVKKGAHIGILGQNIKIIRR